MTASLPRRPACYNRSPVRRLAQQAAAELFEFCRLQPTDPRFCEMLALRYQVYCEERRFERPQDHPAGLEQDEYDAHSVHFVAIHRRSGRLVGTVRLILWAEKPFPAEQAFSLSRELLQLQPQQLAEVSRLALSRRYRQELRRQDARTAPALNELVGGLLRCLVEEGVRRGVTHFYAVMARALPVLLARRQLFFRQIGPEREYHGRRAPYLGSVAALLLSHPQWLARLPRALVALEMVAPLPILPPPPVPNGRF
ncbi:PEP-CTERM/exosortase system-associated acyltransferase [Desulfuromonas thiophila]|uniref:PEP-CTERM/exosortase system-associated acyltransferase n=1 Tax=Desulfuromonas thiophila TaxID=57664 RepID=UPI0024A8512B|nr:PEP-CTERM/exosortase system-associated acyltransferase [Desulfuromonas thiophila]